MPPALRNALSDDDRTVLERSGYGRRQGIADRPALVVIDATREFVGLDDDLQRSVELFPAGVGRSAWKAAKHIQQLLKAFRSLNLPVVFTRPGRATAQPGSVRRGKRDRVTYEVGANEIIPELAPEANEVQIEKRAPSAFFATGLDRLLAGRAVDGVVLVGFTTSGCVRASAVDAFSNDLKVTVPRDAVADRLSLSHWATLLDVDLKYGDVTTTKEVLYQMGAPGG